jgi:hypothetical protein
LVWCGNGCQQFLIGFSLGRIGVGDKRTPIPTQFKAPQLVVAQAVWATQRIDPYFNQSVLFLMHQNNDTLLLDKNAMVLLDNATL